MLRRPRALAASLATDVGDANEEGGPVAAFFVAVLVAALVAAEGARFAQ